MADAAVEFLLGNLKDLLLYHPNLIYKTKKEIENLEIDLRFFNAFLKDLHSKRRKDVLATKLIGNIRDVVYEMEDVIEDFVTQALGRKSTSFSRFWKPAINLHEIGMKVEDVKQNIERAKFELANVGVHIEDNYEKPKARPPRQKNVVGFADVTEELVHRLTSETDNLDVVCLTGMFGLGKTTVAWKVFNDNRIVYEFPVRIWLPISQEFSEKEIFLNILEEFTTITDGIRRKDVAEIAQLVDASLEKKKFLIVVDDVWSCDDWDRLKVALPNISKGKILITSRIQSVGEHACNPRLPHQLRFFTQKESWELLRQEAFRTTCPSELENVGQLIARDCDGLPLSVVIIGGILASKVLGSDKTATSYAWEKVSTKVTAYLKDDPEHRMNNFISLSYDKLPYQLQACFLYLGMFPEDYEIPASKLVGMWIGEGFIQQSTDDTLEEIGEKYLEDLVNRNLVRIEKINYDGKVKTCRIHSTFRDFCQTEAQKDHENFFQEVRFRNDFFEPPISDLHKYRRLSIHSDCLKFISSKPYGPRVRSFVCYPKEKFALSNENIPDILKAFKLLRVLDVRALTFPKLDRDFFQLVHVRYIALSLDASVLPEKFSQFWSLQTLIVDTTSRKLDVRADLLKLIKLRHFKTNASATLPKPGKDSKHGAELQTLGTISVESCTSELPKQACNLKKLGVRGRLSLLLEGKIGSFDSLGRMKHLENLKLINDVHPLPPSEGRLHRLPQAIQFPYRLKSLTLRATYLEWSNISTLAMLVILEVLKLKDNAFIGKRWEAVEGGFQRLQFLHIHSTDLGVWDASSHHYPRLKGLVLRNCEELLAVPIGLAGVESFQALELFSCTSAVDSAKDIQEAKKTVEAPFKLTIFPPIV